MNEINDTENKLLRVASYLRLSDEDKDKENKYQISESIKNQRNMLIEFIEKNPSFILVQEYCDEDLSGAGTFRPEFERLIKDCEMGKIDIVLCKSQSRFSRDMEIVEKYINNKFREWGIRFISLSDNADTENPGNKKSRQINGLVNEWYLEDTSNNIRSAFNTKMKHGEFISPFAPFGYEVDSKNNNKIIIDPIASEIVKDIFNLYLKGYGFTGIAKYLNNKNIPSPSLYKYQKGIKLNVVSNRPREQIKWGANAIKTILKNEIYLGHLIQGKRTTISYKNHKLINKNRNDWIRVNNTHDAIIDEDTFKMVQNEINKRTRPKNSFGIIHNFSGKVFCKECGHYLRKKNSTKHEYLVCANNRDGYNDCINKSGIRYDVLENLVLEAINKKIIKYYDEEELLKIDNANKSKPFVNKIISLEKQKSEICKKINDTKNYLRNLYEDKVNGHITIEEFKSLIANYSKNEDIYKKQIKSIEQEILLFKTKEKAIKDNKDLFTKYKSLTNLNRVVINEFIKRIYISKINKETTTRDIEIVWNFE